jgi:hypothetical protein
MKAKDDFLKQKEKEELKKYGNICNKDDYIRMKYLQRIQEEEEMEEGWKKWQEEMDGKE